MYLSYGDWRVRSVALSGEGTTKLMGLRNFGRSQKFFMVMVELILCEVLELKIYSVPFSIRIISYSISIFNKKYLLQHGNAIEKQSKDDLKQRFI